MYKVIVTKRAEKEFDNLDRLDAKRTYQKAVALNFPFAQNADIKKLVNLPDCYRLRCSGVRVIFEVDHKSKEIWIRRVGYRGGIY